MSLKDILEHKERAANTSPSSLQKSKEELPTFRYNDAQNKLKKRKKIIILVSLSLLLVLLIGMICIVYLPQLFLSDAVPNEYIVTPNAEALVMRKKYIEDNFDADFDGDGLNNGDELEKGTSVYNPDSDGDGVYDGNDKTPLSKDDDLYYVLTEDGSSINSPYQMDDVIMWADDKSSFLHGGVIKTVSGGYHFSDFSGWVRFASVYDKYTAYIYENGVHSSLKYDVNKQAWYIPGTCDVIFTDDEPGIVYYVECFGSGKYYKNTVGAILNFLLPEKGYITSREMWLDDTFINVDTNYITSNQNIKIDLSDPSRFASNDTSLETLMSIYYAIDNDSAVAASIVDEKDGEAIVIIYGYTISGDLLVRSQDGKKDILSINPIAAKILGPSGSVIQSERFEFEGCGFSSRDGDTICFFAGAVNSEKEPIDISNSIDETQKDNVNSEENNSSDISDAIPENGIYENNGQIYYYINGLPAVDRFIRQAETGLFEYCTVDNAGAFYVDENGQKIEGLIDFEGTTYCYANDGFVIDSFFEINNDGYIFTSVPGRESRYCDENGVLAKGWFVKNGSTYYASMENFFVLKNCFVKNESGAFRYLGSDGKMQKNKLVELDGREILIDGKGNIINYDYVKNIISKHTRE